MENEWIELIITKPFSLNTATENLHSGGRQKTSSYKEWRATAGWQINIQSSKPITGSYELEIITGRNVSKADVDNLIKPISDLLVNLKLTADDSKMIRCESIYVEDLTHTKIRYRETKILTLQQWRDKECLK